MKYIILGLLLLKPLSIYDINKAFQNIISLFYSPSYGSINTAMKKLLAKKMVECKEEVIQGRNKIVYTILEAGKKEFIGWMLSEINPNKLEVTALSKLFFLGLVDKKEDKINIISNIVNTAKSEKERLETLKKETQAYEVPKSYKEIFLFQLKTLDYGLNSYQFSFTWFEKLLKELKKG
jgi:PadR family transcriptional regulator, regulatory protein AphA